MENSKQKTFGAIKSSLPLIYLIIALLALRWTIVEPYVVPTSSMEPTLKTGDRLYAMKCAYDVRFPFTEWILFRTGSVKRGDVILFRAPQDPSVTYVKRAVGIPGDKLEYHDGTLFVNGQEILKAQAPDTGIMYDIEHKEDKTLFLENLTGVKHWVILNNAMPQNRFMAETAVPPGYLFAMGDNRDNSHDSRAWGYMPMENLKGKGMFIWFSSWEWRVRPERIGTLIQ